MVWKIIRCLTLYMNLHLILRMMTLLNFQKAISEFWRKLKNIENVEDREEWLRRTFEKESENNRTEQVNRVIPLINIQLVG